MELRSISHSIDCRQQRQQQSYSLDFRVSRLSTRDHSELLSRNLAIRSSHLSISDIIRPFEISFVHFRYHLLLSSLSLANYFANQRQRRFTLLFWSSFLIWRWSWGGRGWKEKGCGEQVNLRRNCGVDLYTILEDQNELWGADLGKQKDWNMIISATVPKKIIVMTSQEGTFHFGLKLWVAGEVTE